MRTAKCQKAGQACKQLTPRQMVLTKCLLDGATITDAARDAGYSEKNLAQSGHQALKAICLSMPEVLDEIGLTERALIEKHLVPLLFATTTRFFQYGGKVTGKRIVADNDARLRALDMALRLRGTFAAADLKLAEPTGVKVIIMDVPRPPRTAAIASPQFTPPKDR
jgi:hypothetical protein